MKSNLKRWVGRVPDMSAVMSRFPVAVALMAIFTLIIIIENHVSNNEPLGRMLVGLIIAAYLSFSITVAREAKDQSRLIPVQILMATAVAALAWFSKELRINLVMAMGAALLLLGNVVIWRKTRDDLHVWDFTHKIWTGAVFATVGSIIFTAGIFSIQFALKSLFGFSINELTERLLLPIGLGFLAPLYWLSTVPKTDESYQELYDNPGFVSKAVAFLGTWILSPLTLIYALILIAYGVKIILAGSLPKGEIAALTTPFLLVGALTWLVLEPPFIKEKALAKLFRKLWFPLSIPASLLLAVSVWVRISEYGFTPERIALMMAVIWTLGLGLWFTIGPKAKRDIRLVPGSAAALLLLGAFGAEILTVKNQKMRAVAGLKAAGVMEADGTVKPLLYITITDEKAARKAKGALGYLMKQREGKTLERIFADAANIPKFDNYDRFKLFKRLSLQNVELPNSRFDWPGANYNSDGSAISILGYEKLYGPFNINSSSRRSQSLVSDIDVEIRSENELIVFLADDSPIAEFNVENWVNSLTVFEYNYIIEKDLISVLDNGSHKIAIKVQSMNSWNMGESENNSLGVNFDFFVLTAGF
jgi:hypothetical protein